jgi:hypothetical protein
MHWGAYEVFSVLSGLALIACSFLPSDGSGSRLWTVGGGIAFVGYGIFVASRDTGVYVFPVWIFFIPFAAVIYAISVAVKRSSRDRHDPGRAPAGDERSTDW